MEPKAYKQTHKFFSVYNISVDSVEKDKDKVRLLFARKHTILQLYFTRTINVQYFEEQYCCCESLNLTILNHKTESIDGYRELSIWGLKANVQT